MELIDLLQQAHGGNGLKAIGEQFGLDDNQTASAVQQLAPVIAAGLRRNMAQSPDNVVSLLEALNKGNHEEYVDNVDAVQFGNVSGDGNAILGHIFGSKDVSREVALRAAGSSGIGSSILKKLMPVIASMVLGSVTKKMTGGRSSSGGGIIGDILGDVLGGNESGGNQGGGGLGDIIGDVLGGGRSQPQQRRAPQPVPQGRTGGLDDLLKDILGGGRGNSRPQANPRQRRDAGRTFDGGGSYDQGPSSYNTDVLDRSRTSLDDVLGGGSKRGNEADDLLNSVEDHLRRL